DVATARSLAKQVLLQLGCFAIVSAAAAMTPSSGSARGSVYVVEQGIFRTDLAGASWEVVEYLDVDTGYFGLTVDSVTGWWYWSQQSFGFAAGIFGRDPAGQTTLTIASDVYPEEYSGISVDEAQGRIYWTSALNGGTILRAHLDGSSRES